MFNESELRAIAYRLGTLPPGEVSYEEVVQRIKDATAPQLAGQVELDHREIEQISHAITYAKHHSGAGVPGHSQFMLIAKLARRSGIDHA